MTYGDIKKEIFALGFETEARYKENGDIIPFAINRALRVINSEVRAILGKSEIKSKALKSVCNENFGDFAGAPISFRGKDAKSYVFKCDGEGKAVIKDKNGSRDIILSGIKEYKGFCSGDSELTFFGDFSYSVFDLAFYDEIFSLDEREIPGYGENLVINLRDYCVDFLAFSKLYLKDLKGKEQQARGYRLENNNLLILPREVEGIYTLYYKKTLPIYTAETEDRTEIIIDEDLFVLIPLLASFYIWLDDDATKATMYRNEYETLRNSILISENKAVAKVWGGRNRCL